MHAFLISPSRLARVLALTFAAVCATWAQTPSTTPAAAGAKLFAVTFTTGPNWDAAKPFPEQKFSKEHSASLGRMRSEGLAVLGGRFGDKGLLIVRAADEAAVRAELAKDPSVGAGTFHAAVEEYRPFFHGDTKPPAASAEIAIVRRAFAAFNAHDADGVAALLADEVKMFFINADAQTVEGDGREAIRTWLTGYFKSLPDTRSEITDLTQSGAHVSFRERATWTAKDGSRRTQTTIGIYEVREGKVRRVWYFPATREPAAPSSSATSSASSAK